MAANEVARHHMRMVGAILAGGRSSRMGRPKEGVRLSDGVVMIEPVLRALGARCPAAVVVGACLALLTVFSPGKAAAQLPPAEFFTQNCKSCHTIGGGRLTGPDLKGVTQRKDRAWLGRFLTNPQSMIDSGDAYALQLQKDARGVVMPTIPGMTPAQAGVMVDFLEAESKQGQSQFAGGAAFARASTPAEVAQGMRIFRGSSALKNGGPACSSCHTLATLRGLGGGRLGPDLTLVKSRLGGRQALGAWLSAPATPTMKSVFGQRPIANDEIVPLLGVIDVAAAQGAAAPTSSYLSFLALGLGLAAVGLISLNVAGRHRFGSVRQRLVHGERTPHDSR